MTPRVLRWLGIHVAWRCAIVQCGCHVHDQRKRLDALGASNDRAFSRLDAVEKTYAAAVAKAINAAKEPRDERAKRRCDCAV